MSIKITHYNKSIVCIRGKSIIPVKNSGNCESKSNSCLYIDITNHFSFLRFNSKGKACILNWNFSKESWRNGIVALTYTNRPPLL